MPHLSKELVEHRLAIKRGFKPYKHSARNFNPKIVSKIKVEVDRLLQASFMSLCYYMQWVYDSRISPDLPRGTGKSIRGDLDIDDEGSEQRRFKSVQSLHHGSVGYQPMHTRIGLTKKTMSLQVNQEHKQKQERTISNCR
jgi:hypothetical protein